MLALAVVNGDLAIGPGGYAQVTGVDKVRQDLSIALREPLGIDRFHSGWGSLLDSDLGQPIDQDLAVSIRSEVIRIVQNYMAVQQSRLAADTAGGGRTRLRPDEIVQSIEDVNVKQVTDRFFVRLNLKTGGGLKVSILQAVTA